MVVLSVSELGGNDIPGGVSAQRAMLLAQIEVRFAPA
jgi:hypothetical protein